MGGREGGREREERKGAENRRNVSYKEKKVVQQCVRTKARVQEVEGWKRDGQRDR